MKSFAVATLVAVAVAFASQQQVSADGGWYWKGNIGLNLSWDAAMGCYSNPTQCGSPYGCPPHVYGYAPAYSGYPAPAPYAYNYAPQGYAQGYAAPAAPAPAAQQAAP